MLRTGICVDRNRIGILTLVRQGLSVLLCALAVALVPIHSSRAELVTTDTAIAGVDASAARAELNAFLGREDVRAQLQQLGVEPEAARARVAALTDAEVLELSGRMNELPAGGATVVAVVAGILVVSVTLLVITDLLGFTDVFSFINPLPNRGS
jgi:hypothetical protein